MRSEASIMEQVKSEQENNLLQIIDYKETKNHLYILMEVIMTNKHSIAQ
jgi:hypothetical protein